MTVTAIATVAAGQTVRYESPVDAPRIGTVVEVVTDRWGTRYAVRWDGELTVGTTSTLLQVGWELITLVGE